MINVSWHSKTVKMKKESKMPKMTSEEAFRQSKNNWFNNNQNFQQPFVDLEKTLENEIANAIKLGRTSCEHTIIFDDDGSNKSMIWAKANDIADKYEDMGYSTYVSYNSSLGLFGLIKHLVTNSPVKTQVTIKISWDDEDTSMESMLD